MIRPTRALLPVIALLVLSACSGGGSTSTDGPTMSETQASDLISVFGTIDANLVMDTDKVLPESRRICAKILNGTIDPDAEPDQAAKAVVDGFTWVELDEAAGLKVARAIADSPWCDASQAS